MRELLKQISDTINRNWPSIKKEIEAEIFKTVVHSEIADALRDGGPLAADFGIPIGSGDERVSDIALQIVESCRISKIRLKGKKTGIQILGGIKIQLIVDDYLDVLSLDSSRVGTDKGDFLPWLQWLLLEGSAVAIKLPNPGIDSKGKQNEWYVTYGDFSDNKTRVTKSRSKQAYMLQSTKGVGWRVPTEYAGTENDNWLTRLFTGPEGDRFNSNIHAIIQRYTEKP
jgi:hypothetical protein